MDLPSTDLPPQSTVELGLLSTVARDEDLSAVQEAGLQPDDFIVFADLYSFILEYRRDYGKLPAPLLLLHRAGADWTPPGGEFAYWLDEMVRYTLTRRARLVIRDVLPELEQHPRRAVRTLVDELTGLGLGTRDHAQATDAGISTRFKKYEARSAEYVRTRGQKVWGIKTGLQVIDASHQGWMPGELVGLYARPTVGKTWLLLREGVEAWRYPENRVLLISPEMPAGQIALRTDTLIGGGMGLSVSHRKLYAGDPSVREAYRTLSELVAKNERWWTVDSMDDKPVGLSDISLLYRRFRPTLILIDGISLLRDEEGTRSMWEKMHNLSYGLKQLCTTHSVAAIVTNQAVNTRRGRRGETDAAQGRGDDWVMPSLNDASYGDSFVQACSTVITMCPDRDDYRVRWYSVRKSRERDVAWLPRLALAWDVDRGRITDLGHLGVDEERIRQELDKLVS